MSQLVRVMISSRVNDGIGMSSGKSTTLSAVRKKLKEEVEFVLLLGKAIFEVWINELAPAAEGSSDAWTECLDQVKEADIVIVLFNGNSGRAKEAGGIGICHAELLTALASASNRVRLIELPLQPLRGGSLKEQDELFRRFAASQGLFRAAAVDGNDAIEKCKDALSSAVAQMAKDGARAARRPRFDAGEALDWSRLDFRARQTAIETTVRNALLARSGAQETQAGISVPVDGKQVLFLARGIPAALGIAPARELVGQPFLLDHRSCSTTESQISLKSVESDRSTLLGCHRSVTESQAARIPGRNNGLSRFRCFRRR